MKDVAERGLRTEACLRSVLAREKQSLGDFFGLGAKCGNWISIRVRLALRLLAMAEKPPRSLCILWLTGLLCLEIRRRHAKKG